MKPLGRFAIDFSMVRISEVRSQMSSIGKCISGNQQSQNAFSMGRIEELEFTRQLLEFFFIKCKNVNILNGNFGNP